MTDELWAEVDRIEGWLTRDEAKQLHDLCNGTWCEIGSWKGRSTRVLADKGHGYAIDWFKGNIETEGADTLAAFTANTTGLDITVIPNRMELVVKQVKKPIHLLFIDGEHTYKATKQAFDLYESKVVTGGYIILHDVNGYMGGNATFPGVTQFADELIKNKRYMFVADANRNRAFKKL